MRLLVGGDSFAQRPTNISDNNIHWCDLLASEFSTDADFVGIGGGDISTTTLRTVSALLSGQYTHCVFFITDWFRDVVHLTPSDPYKKVIQYNPNKFYNDIYLPQSLFGRKVFTEDSKYRFTGYFNLMEPDLEPNPNELNNYLYLKADYTYMHDRLSNLSMLSTVAKKCNVKLMYVEVFNTLLSNTNVDTFVQDFVCFNYLKQWNTDYYKFFDHKDNTKYRSAPSHHSPQQHKDILQLFLAERPNWLT